MPPDQAYDKRCLRLFARLLSRIPVLSRLELEISAHG